MRWGACQRVERSLPAFWREALPFWREALVERLRREALLQAALYNRLMDAPIKTEASTVDRQTLANRLEQGGEIRGRKSERFAVFGIARVCAGFEVGVCWRARVRSSRDSLITGARSRRE